MRFLTCLLFVACTKTVDTGETGTDAVDTSETDTSETDTSDTDFQPDPDCTDYEPWADSVVSCDGVWTQVWMMLSLSHPYDGTCTPYYADSLGGAWATPSDAFAELSCDTACVYAGVGQGDLVWCTYRGGFEYYDVGGEGQVGDGAACDDLVYVDTCAGSAYATSVEAYEAAYPCEDHVDTCPPR